MHRLLNVRYGVWFSTKADAALIRLIDDEVRELVIAAHSGFSESELNSIIKRRATGEGLSWRYFQTGK
ncbi:MAG: hypothetical protein V2B19_11870, partial [Pseudomonadota bacterium]